MSLPERSLYLYFLDRELGESMQYELSPGLARSVVQTLIIGTNSRLLCGLSLLYENSNIDASTVQLLKSLVAANALDIVSHHITFAEFKASRVVMYRHDAARYPAYFTESALPEIEPTLLKSGGTTVRIVSGMREWANGVPEIDPRYRVTSAELRSPVIQALDERSDRAVTFPLFKPYLGELANSPVAENHIRRSISRLFAADYRDFGENDLPTGVRGLEYFEQDLALDFPFYDVQILGELVRLVGIRASSSSIQDQARWEALVATRDSEAHSLLVANFRWIIASFAHIFAEPISNKRQHEVRFRSREILRRMTSPQAIGLQSLSGEDLYSISSANAGILARQLRKDPRLAGALDRLHDEYLPPPQTDVLLVVATEVEHEAVIKVFDNNGYRLTDRSFSTTNAYQRFSPIGGARVTLVRCSMGQGGPGGPELTVAEAIGALAPTSVIMVGIAFGIDAHKQKIGDVLLSTHILDYELERVGTDKQGKMVGVSRGSRPDASPRLLSRFRMARLGNYGLSMREGPILSGKKLIDNLDYRDSLHEAFPDAIGGEMEGHGVYSAALRSKVDWIVAKAICDWADGDKHSRKEYRQNLAATNAALAVVRTMELGGFT